jgi:hypothetical protein
MSFIYSDKKLLEGLLVSGLTSVIKEAQNKKPPVVTPTDFPAYHVADTLNVQLQRTMGTPGAPPKGIPLGVPEGVDSTAYPENLRTLGDFILWCANKKFTWEGQRFAWAPNEAHPTQAENPDIWDFESMKSDRARDELTRKPLKVPAVANVKALTEYLVVLRDNEKNQVTRLMLSKLIGELNTYLRTGNKPEIDSVSKPEVKPNFDPADIVDGFPSNVLNGADPYAGTNGYPFFEKAVKKLTAGDIATQGAFLAWLRGMQVVMPDKSTVTADKADTDAPCVAVNILYKRAVWLKQYGAAADKTKANYSKLTEAYVKAVQEYGSKLTGADGKPCAVTAPGTSKGEPGKQPAKPGTGKVDPMALNKVVMALPLRVETLDFDKIDQFFEEYSKLNPNVTQWENPATTYMDSASGMTISKMRRFSMLSGARDVMTWLKPPQANQGNPYAPFLNQLKSVLNMVGQALQDLKARYADTESGESMIADKTQVARINAQILGSNSIWESNNNAIETLLSQIGSVSPTYTGKKYPY